MLLEFAESGCPIFRAASPLSRGRLKKQRSWKIVDQLSLYGAFAEMCEGYETLHDRSGQPVVGRQSSSSLVLSVIKTDVPLDCDDLANKRSSIATIWRTN